MEGYDATNKNEFFQDSLATLDREIKSIEEVISGSSQHPAEHRAHHGHCHDCVWLDPEHPSNKEQDDNGLTRIDRRARKLAQYKQAREAMNKLTEDEWFSVVDFCLGSFYAEGRAGLQVAVMGPSDLEGALGELPEELKDLLGNRKTDD